MASSNSFSIQFASSVVLTANAISSVAGWTVEKNSLATLGACALSLTEPETSTMSSMLTEYDEPASQPLLLCEMKSMESRPRGTQ